MYKREEITKYTSSTESESSTSNQKNESSKRNDLSKGFFLLKKLQRKVNKRPPTKTRKRYTRQKKCYNRRWLEDGYFHKRYNNFVETRDEKENKEEKGKRRAVKGDKSLSKKVKTSLHRKIKKKYPVKLDKIRQVKQKSEKMRKPTRSLKNSMRNKFSDPKLVKYYRMKKCNRGGSISHSDPEMNSDDGDITGKLTKKSKLFSAVTPQMIVLVLGEPSLFKTGATLKHIVKQLKKRGYNIDSKKESLYEELRNKLECAEHVGFIKESKGLYWLTKSFRKGNLSKKQVLTFWKLFDEKYLNTLNRAQARKKCIEPSMKSSKSNVSLTSCLYN